MCTRDIGPAFGSKPFRGDSDLADLFTMIIGRGVSMLMHNLRLTIWRVLILIFYSGCC